MVYQGCHFDALSQVEAQPFLSEDLAVILDGRLDNRSDLLISLRDELRGETTDVALVTAAYKRWGLRGLARLIGDWSVVIWDARANAVMLASDYAGVCPLYYRLDSNQGIRWSSSLIGIVKWTDSGDNFDESWIAGFLTMRPNCDRTIYQRIRSVPPAHVVRVSEGRASIAKFWSPSAHDKIRFQDHRRYEEELLHHFREAVAVRLRSDRPVSCDLTGGLDSSSVTCMAHNLVKSGSVDAKHLIAFTELDHYSDDEKYARIVRDSLGIDEICCDMESLWCFDPNLPQPTKSSTRRRLRAKLLMEAGVRVNLTGSAGDFIMGNEVDDRGQLADHIAAGRLGMFLKGAYHWSLALRVPIYQTIFRGIVPLLKPEIQMTMWRSQQLAEGNPYRHTEKHQSCYTRRILSHPEPSSSLEICAWNEGLPGVRRFLAALDSQNLCRTLESPIEVEPIRNSHPYLHRPLVEFVISIPRAQLCAPGKPRSLMRRAFAELLPFEILNRTAKASIGYQQYIEAQQLVHHLPARPEDWDVVKRGWVDANALRTTLSAVSESKLREWSEMKRILTLETWFQAPKGQNASKPVRTVAHSLKLKREERKATE
jgi:asparagine synthase (glutamine-hydrolysing)